MMTQIPGTSTENFAMVELALLREQPDQALESSIGGLPFQRRYDGAPRCTVLAHRREGRAPIVGMAVGHLGISV